MKFYPTKNHPSCFIKGCSFLTKNYLFPNCFIKGCFTLFKIYLSMIILYWGGVFLKFQYMTWNFNFNGGASVFRNACMELKPVLLASTDSTLLFHKYDLPPKHPLRKLRPQFLSYGVSKNGASVYNILTAGGLFYSGYEIFESKDNIPSKIFVGPKDSIIKDIGDGVFIYQGMR